MDKRKELKFLITAPQKNEILNILQKYSFELDENCESDHQGYEISSLYYDTPDLKFLAEKLNGDQNKNKIRVRNYNSDPNAFFMERKINCQGKISKSRYHLKSFNPKHPLFTYLKTPELCFDIPVNLIPQIDIRYDRLAFSDNFKNRITFDENLRSKKYFSKEFQRYYQFETEASIVMELKFLEASPLFILLMKNYNSLSFSKYAECMLH